MRPSVWWVLVFDRVVRKLPVLMKLRQTPEHPLAGGLVSRRGVCFRIDLSPFPSQTAAG